MERKIMLVPKKELAGSLKIARIGAVAAESCVNRKLTVMMLSLILRQCMSNAEHTKHLFKQRLLSLKWHLGS